MKCPARLAAAAVWLLAVVGAEAVEDEWSGAYTIVADAAIPVLPEKARPFFESHLQALQRRATVDLALSVSDGRVRDEAEMHYILLDAGEDLRDRAACRAAAMAVPHRAAAARRWFRRRQITAGGRLPWVIGEHYDRLVRAFKSGDEAAILRASGDLLHLATDAALPFNTTAAGGRATADYDHWPVSTAAGSRLLHRTVRHRVQVGLIAKSQQRFEYEVRVWPPRWRRLEDPVEVAFAVLLESHAMVGPLLDVDRALVDELSIESADAFVAASDRYYEGLTRRAAPIIEQRLEEGALLAARLIGSAWDASGQPEPGKPHATERDTAESGEETQAAPAPAVGLVGSVSGKVYHVPSCPHAKRIKPANLVRFSSKEEAQAGSRKPCRTCKPDRRQKP